MKIFQSAFAEHLSAYIKLRHALGFRSEDATFFLEALGLRRNLWVKKRQVEHC